MSAKYSRQADIDAVRPLVPSDLTTSEISDTLGIHVKRVQAAMRALGVDRHRSSRIARKRNRINHYRALLTPLIEEGLTATEIAEKLDLSMSAVTSAMRDLGIDLVTRGRALRKDRATHGDPAMWQKCDCEVCVTARREYKHAERERAKEAFDPSQVEHGTAAAVYRGCTCAECRAFSVRHLAQRQAESRKTASEHGQEWDGEQVEIVASGRYTIQEAAEILGRTYAAISNVRKALADPDHPSHLRYTRLLDEK